MKKIVLTSFILIVSLTSLADSSNLEQCLSQAKISATKEICFVEETQIQKIVLDQVYTETLALMAQNRIDSSAFTQEQNNWLTTSESSCMKQVNKATDDEGQALTVEKKNLGLKVCLYLSTVNKLSSIYIELGVQRQQQQNSL